MLTTKYLIIAGCLFIGATFTNAQGIKQDMQRQQQQAAQREQSIKAERERQQRLQAEREEAARRAEQERLKREERKRLGIPDITKDDLIENASYLIHGGFGASYAKYTENETAQSKGKWGNAAIEWALTLDVYAWNKLKYDGGGYKPPYETELKRKVFEESDEYKQKLEDLKAWRSKLLQTVLFAKVEHGYGGFEPEYNMERRAFKVHTHKMRMNPIDKELLNDFIFNTLPVTEDDDTYLTNGTQFFWLKVDEKTAIEIEGNEDVQLYVFFMLNGKIKETGFQGKLFYSDKVRIVLAHQKSGKIYYDRSFPEGCLPIAKQETLSTEDYLAYKAEQERIVAEKKAAERRREMEKIQEERRKEQERIEAAKRAEEEKIEAAKQKAIADRKAKIDDKMSLYTFEQEKAFSSFGSTSKFYGGHGIFHCEGKQPDIVYGDSPDGKGKSLLISKKNTFTINRYPTFSVWIKDEGDKNTCYFTENAELIHGYTKTILSQFVANKSQLVYKQGSKSYVISENNPFRDKQWHLLTVTLSDDAYKFYIDGKIIKSENVKKPMLTERDVFYHIQMRGNNGEFKIDNLRYCDILLTDEEIANIYNEERKNTTQLNF